MKTFTIDTENNISAFATPEAAAAATSAPVETFASQKELAALAAKWPADRLVAIWNSLTGVEPVKKSLRARRSPPGVFGSGSRPWARLPRKRNGRRRVAHR